MIDPPTPYDPSLWLFTAVGIGFVLAAIAWLVLFSIRRDERP